MVNAVAALGGLAGRGDRRNGEECSRLRSIWEGKAPGWVTDRMWEISERKGNEVDDQICNTTNCIAPSIRLKGKRRDRIVGS